MINVAIKEGWAGGEYFTRQFRQALNGAGFTLTDVKHADAIIAHSTACYDLSEQTPATIYILIDPPYWPGKSILGRAISKKRTGTSTVSRNQGWKQMIKETFWEGIYIASKPGYTSVALKKNAGLDFLGRLGRKSIYLIRNQDDEFCSPDIQTALAAYPNVTFVPMPGEHDDYYTNHQPYINLLNHYFKSIGKQ